MQKITPFLWFDNQAEEAARVMQAMLQMDKIDLKALQQAYDGHLAFDDAVNDTMKVTGFGGAFMKYTLKTKINLVPI